MTHRHSIGLACATLAAAASLSLCAGLGLAQTKTPAQAPGWTGTAHVDDVIAARFGLMVEAERLMQPIDLYTIDEPAEPEALRTAAGTVGYLLRALPHLFPPTTNLYDPEAETPKTIALPSIWENFDDFYALAGAAAAAAERMAATSDAEALRARAIELRGSCDACHAQYLRKYEGPSISTEDLDFDFDSVLGQ
jgi:cytochrome c556